MLEGAALKGAFWLVFWYKASGTGLAGSVACALPARERVRNPPLRGAFGNDPLRYQELPRALRPTPCLPSVTYDTHGLSPSSSLPAATVYNDAADAASAGDLSASAHLWYNIRQHLDVRPASGRLAPPKRAKTSA